MGQWFTNISVRKTGNVSIGTVREYWINTLAGKGFTVVEDGSTADCCAALITSTDSEWITLASDFISLENPDDASDMLRHISGTLSSDALGIACFDSDYGFMNLINAKEKLDAWVNIGSAAEFGVRRRTGLRRWANKVSDFEKFSAAARSGRVFAEDAICDMAEYLALPAAQATAGDALQSTDARIYFRFPANAALSEPPALDVCVNSSGDVPIIGKSAYVHFINHGGASRGFIIYISGSFVEHGEITFDAYLFRRSANSQKPHAGDYAALELRRLQLANGMWVYAAVIDDYPIPADIPEGLSESRRYEELSRRDIRLRLTPRGRGAHQPMAMSASVIAVPAENPGGYGV